MKPLLRLLRRSHIALNVGTRTLRVAHIHDMPPAIATVELIVYRLRDIDVALLTLEYLQRHADAFASVTIV